MALVAAGSCLVDMIAAESDMWQSVELWI